MEQNRTHRYYVFGAGSGAGQLSYIGLCDRPPAQCTEDIFRNLADTASEPVRRWAAAALADGAADTFEIEECVSPKEAGEAVSFWTQYFRFLGVRLIGAEQFSAEPLPA